MPERRTWRHAVVGREQELGRLDGLLDAVRHGESRALVLHGDPGIGKTTLLDHIAQQATDCRVLSAAGVEAEMELSDAALHQLCARLFDRLELLPKPQQDALRVTFGISDGPVPDRLLVGLGVLSLFSESAVERPVVCLVDDAQWLDQASAQVLAFVGRRLGAESVAIVIGTRQLSPQFAGLPEMAVGGLDDDAARSLLASARTGPIDERVLRRLLAESGGNPLAMLELPRAPTYIEFGGGPAYPSSAALSASITEGFRRRVDMMPAETQHLLLVAAADPLGDPLLLWRAAELLGIPTSAARPAVDEGLVSLEGRVRFRHPLVRSAVYRSASVQAKRQVHGALAEVTDPRIDPERRAMHRAQAASGPDEDVAAELELHAERAQARSGLAAAAAFLERATTLSADPAKRAKRALAASEAKVQAGALGAALELLGIAEAGPLSELDRPRVSLVRAHAAFAADRFATNHRNDAPPLLLQAALELEPIDPQLARATYLNALMASMLAGDLAGPEADIATVARAAASAPNPDTARQPTPSDLLLEGLVTTFNQDYAAGHPIVTSALIADRAAMPAALELRWLSLAYRAAIHFWDDETALKLSARSIGLAREVGALSELAVAINDSALYLFLSGDTTAAAAAVQEAHARAEAFGSGIAPYGPMAIAAWRGDEVLAADLIEAWRRNSQRRGEGSGIAGADWAQSVLHNGLANHEAAFAAAQRALASANRAVLGLSNWAIFELIEAAPKSANTDAAGGAYRQLKEMAAVTGKNWALGTEALARASRTEGEAAEKLYREATGRLDATRIKAHSARAHLLFGEWLRRQRRRADARAELRTALEMLQAMEMKAFAERATRELRATGETARKRSIDTGSALTAQESQVAKLARDGLSNPEIAARLYISARTVQYHLSKVFTKLGITSRSQLDRALI